MRQNVPCGAEADQSRRRASNPHGSFPGHFVFLDRSFDGRLRGLAVGTGQVESEYQWVNGLSLQTNHSKDRVGGGWTRQGANEMLFKQAIEAPTRRLHKIGIIRHAPQDAPFNQTAWQVA